MDVKFKDLAVYYINPEFYPERRIRMDAMLDSWGVYYERILSDSSAPDRQTRINEAFIKLAEKAIQNNKYPFLVLEDDATPIGELPEIFNIPEEAQFIYWGGSLYDTKGLKPNLMITDYSREYYRLYYSLACHAIIIPNRKSAELFIKINKDAIKNTQFSDVYFARESGVSIVLTPKDGMYFYQNDPNTKPLTYIKWGELKQKYLK